MGFPPNCAQCREILKLCAMKKFFRAARMAKKFFGFWRGQKIFRFWRVAKINPTIKERVRRFGKHIDFLLFFFAARGARQESPLWGREEKFFIFFNVDMRLGRVFFFA